MASPYSLLSDSFDDQDQLDIAQAIIAAGAPGKRDFKEKSSQRKVFSETTKNTGQTLSPLTIERAVKSLAGGDVSFRDESGDLFTEQYEGVPEFKQQRQGAEDLKTQLEAYMKNRPVQTDLSPLAALVDQWSGSKLAQSYNKPESLQERMSNDASMASTIQKSREGLTKEVTDWIKAVKAGSVQERLFDLLQTGAKAGTKAESPMHTNASGTNAKRFRDTFFQEPMVKPAYEALAGAHDIKVAATKPNWLTDQSLAAGLTKAAKLYPVSNLDLSLYRGAPDAYDTVDRFVKKLIKGDRLLPSDRHAITEYAKMLESDNNVKIKQFAEGFAERVAPQFGYGKETAIGLLQPAGDVSMLGTKVQDKPPAKGAGPNPAQAEAIKRAQANPNGANAQKILSIAKKKGWIK